MYVFVGTDLDIKGNTLYSMFDSATYTVKQLKREELEEFYGEFYGNVDVNLLLKENMQSGAFFMRSIDKTTFKITLVSNIFIYKKWAVISNCKETLIFYDKVLRFSYSNSEYYVHSLYPSQNEDTIYLDECNRHNQVEAHGYVGQIWTLSYNEQKDIVDRQNTHSMWSKWSLAEDWNSGCMTEEINMKTFNLIAAPFMHKAVGMYHQIEERILHSNQCPSQNELFEHTLIQWLLNYKLVDDRKELIDRFTVMDIFFEVTPYYQLKLYSEHYKAPDVPDTVENELACINLKG